LAKKHGVKATGTVAHEWTQAMQALESLNHCNYYAMQNWIKVYNTNLGTYLPDTITTDMFLQNFNRRFAMMFDGTRQDSFCPLKYTDKMVNKYKSLNIDPMSKYIIFSNNLKTLEEIFKIQDYCDGKIPCSFGIGTWWTNDVPESIPLNMVIKLWSMNGFPVVKLSDEEGKEMGDPEAIKNMKWVIKHQLGKC
jgi:nicotinate phosphoribosyltransferase